MLAQAVDTIVSATTFDARIGVGNKGALRELVSIAEV